MAHGYLFFKSAFSIVLVFYLIGPSRQDSQAQAQSPASPNLFAIEEDGATNESVELDFVNLPGYGIVDEQSSAANGNFTCYEKRYGYYADVDKDCTMFHLCYPTRDPKSDEVVFQRFSFLCSESGVFDQQNLVCVENGTAPTVCSESADFYETSNLKLVETLQQSSPGYFADSFEGDNAANSTQISEQSVKPAGTQQSAPVTNKSRLAAWTR